MKILWTLVIPAMALAGVGEPQAGWMRSADGTVRALSGIAGSLVQGDVVAAGSSQFVFNGNFGAIKLANSIRIADGSEFDAPEGDALFGAGFDSSGVGVYFPSVGRAGIITVSGIDWLSIDVRQLGGDVRALSGSTYYVSRADGLHAVTVRRADGAIESDLALGIHVKIAVALPGGWLIYAAPASRLTNRTP